MSLPFHLVPDLGDVAVGSLVTVEGDEAHHAVAVRRLRVGEQVALTDGVGTLAIGAVAETGKRRLDVTVGSVQRLSEPDPRITVVQAIPKGDRGELAVEVLTEIGAALIVPWASARSLAAWKGERGTKALARWRSTAREAAKQARRPWHPRVADPVRTDDVVALIADADLAVVLHEAADGSGASLGGVEVPSSGAIVIVVGPEGGLTDDELAVLAAAGAQPVRLGAEVLRTSTAGVAAAAALLARTPRWGRA